jgi:iron complex outermembrane receptor protein
MRSENGNSARQRWPKTLVAAALAVSALGCWSATAWAQSAPGAGNQPDLLAMSVEELMSVEVAHVVGASRYEQQVTEAPASVSLVTAEEIKRYGYRTLAEALRSVRGIYVSYDRNYAYLGMRGLSRPGDLNTRVLLLLDGHRINDDIYESGPIGTEFPVDVDLIDRIEVIRGPSSSLYGTNAFFGVINVITKKPRDLQGGEVAASGGSFDTFTGRASYGRELGNGLGVLLSASTMRSEGQDRLFYPQLGTATDVDGDRNYQLFGKLNFRDFTLTGALSSRTKDIPTGSYHTIFNDPGTNTTDRYGLIDLKFVHRLDADTELMLRAFYDRYLYDGNYFYDYSADGGPSRVQNKDQAWGSWWGGEAQLTRELGERLKLTAGSEYRFNGQQHQRNFDVAPFFPYQDDRRSSAIWALYLQGELHLLEKLIFSAGVRYDHYDTFGGTTNPRFGLIYKPWDETAFKLLYGRAFRAPSAFEFYYADGGTAEANPALKPERIRTYEAVYEQYLLKHYRSSLSAFYYRIDGLISQQNDPNTGLIQFVNLGNPVDASGGELELEGNWDGGLKGKASYTYQYVRDVLTGGWLSNSPKHLAKLNLLVPLMPERLFVGMEQQYQSNRASRTGTPTGDAYLTNVTLSGRTPLAGLNFSLSVYNLFDRRYSDSGGEEHVQDLIQQDGRSFRAKLEYRF